MPGLFLQIYSELPKAIATYKQRMGIKEIFRDCKSGGYNLEGSGLRGDTLIKMILLMAIAYTWAIFQGTKIHTKQVQKYVSRRLEPRKNYRRRSTFGVGARWRSVDQLSQTAFVRN